MLASSPFGETDGKALGCYLAVILRGVADGIFDHVTGVAYLQHLVVMAARGDLEDVQRMAQGDLEEETGATG
ncbi:hypothetical protein [Chelatococcus sambhunathii]|nr:hypothetical protein [Chelatococcus sambhunathii]